MIGWFDDPLMVMATASLIAVAVAACFVAVARGWFDFGDEDVRGGR